MPRIKPTPLKYNKLIKRLKGFNVVEAPRRGKGSERILILGRTHGKYKGPQIPIKHHGDSTEISKAVIKVVLRRFDIDPKDFW